MAEAADFFAGAAVVAAGAAVVVVAAVVAAAATPVAMNPARAMDVRRFAILIVLTPLRPPGADWVPAGRGTAQSWSWPTTQL